MDMIIGSKWQNATHFVRGSSFRGQIVALSFFADHMLLKSPRKRASERALGPAAAATTRDTDAIPLSHLFSSSLLLHTKLALGSDGRKEGRKEGG
jgi:hypothetical protein